MEEVRQKIPHAAITTDIIVGFPGETEEDFEATMEVVRQARFTSAYTFQYSPRPGTPAAEMENQIPKEVVQARYERLVALQDQISLEENEKLVGTTVELLVQQDGGSKAEKTGRMSGRTVDGRLVHFAVGDAEKPRPGDYVAVEITRAAGHFLISDAGISSHRKTKAGDLSAAGKTPTTAPIGVGLGLPTVGKPAAKPAATGCGGDDSCGC